CPKSPPALLFLLMTLGPTTAALAFFDRGAPSTAAGRALVTLGRVPLFYYLVQWYVIHGLAVLVALVRGQPVAWLFVASPPYQAPPGAAYGLPVVYLMWAVVLAILYPLCRWFAGVKARHRDVRCLSYLGPVGAEGDHHDRDVPAPLAVAARRGPRGARGPARVAPRPARHGPPRRPTGQPHGRRPRPARPRRPAAGHHRRPQRQGRAPGRAPPGPTPLGLPPDPPAT